MVDDAH